MPIPDLSEVTVHLLVYSGVYFSNDALLYQSTAVAIDDIMFVLFPKTLFYFSTVSALLPSRPSQVCGLLELCLGSFLLFVVDTTICAAFVVPMFYATSYN